MGSVQKEVRNTPPLPLPLPPTRATRRRGAGCPHHTLLPAPLPPPRIRHGPWPIPCPVAPVPRRPARPRPGSHRRRGVTQCDIGRSAGAVLGLRGDGRGGGHLCPASTGNLLYVFSRSPMRTFHYYFDSSCIR